MILIADSGSTKCHWALVGNETDIRIKSQGMNPFFCNNRQIDYILTHELMPNIMGYEIEKVLFYGAGCREDTKGVIEVALRRHFPKSIIVVESDLKAAAVALFGSDNGIACIIGTGSVACLYDGKNMIESIPPLGYILGDEGSGAVLGKKLVANYFKQQLPEAIANLFAKQYNLTASELIEKVYREPFPNRFLASFAPFLKKNISEPYIYNLVYDSFEEFLIRNVLTLNKHKELDVSFCGSVAYHFADVLEVVCYELGVSFGTIVASPIDKLVHRTTILL